MFEQLVKCSDAMNYASQQGGRPLIPALCGCLACGTTQMIAAPVLGVCADCGADLTVLGDGDSPRASA
jgi:hypothetical protein